MSEQDEARAMLPYLRAWRIHFLLSQRDVAKKAGITPGTIIRLERGDRANYLTIGKIAKGLGISVQQLVHTNPDEEIKIRGVA